jgi:hypothetical protein
MLEWAKNNPESAFLFSVAAALFLTAAGAMYVLQNEPPTDWFGKFHTSEVIAKTAGLSSLAFIVFGAAVLRR